MTKAGKKAAASRSVKVYAAGGILKFAANRSLARLLRLISKQNPEWIVLTLGAAKGHPTKYFVFKPQELASLGNEQSGSASPMVRELLDLNPATNSAVLQFDPIFRGAEIEQPRERVWAVRSSSPSAKKLGSESLAFGVRPDGQGDSLKLELGRASGIRERHAPGDQGATARRGVLLNKSGTILSILEREVGITVGKGGATEVTVEKQNPSQGGDTKGSSSPSQKTRPGRSLDVLISAEAEKELKVDHTLPVCFKIEFEDEAVPLEFAYTAQIDPAEQIVVSLSVQAASLEVQGPRSFVVQPPKRAEPTTGQFQILGRETGDCALAVSFFQGGTLLGVIPMSITIRSDQSLAVQRVGEQRKAADRDPADDENLILTIEERTAADGSAYFGYILYSEGLQLPNLSQRSKPVLNRGSGIEATKLAYVRDVYRRVAKNLSTQHDLAALNRDVKAIGISLCRELFDPDVVETLWPLRARIKTIQIYSWEPYIPWELVRLRNPITQEDDDRYLAEYGLVRSFQNQMPTRNLRLNSWKYLRGDYIASGHAPVDEELDFFTSNGPGSLAEYQSTPEVTAISATANAFYNALAEGNFDVLHLACHGQAEHEDISSSKLILADSHDSVGQLDQVEVDANTVASEASLNDRSPIVFLNACESGRGGAILTAWGGWPLVFMNAGAGAFIGTAWPVYSKPASVFARTLYGALLNGAYLADAANQARLAAKKVGDASWLAFKVYGHPRAKMQEQ